MEGDAEEAVRKTSDFINDEHFLINEDSYSVHSGRNVRRRRSNPDEQISGGLLITELNIY